MTKFSRSQYEEGSCTHSLKKPKTKTKETHNLSAMKNSQSRNKWRSDNKNIIDSFKELVLNTVEIMVNAMNI